MAQSTKERLIQWPPKTYGERVQYWRQQRKWKRRAFAKMCEIPYTTLASIENGDGKGSKLTPLFAARLTINAHYLASGEGDPHDVKAAPAPVDRRDSLIALLAADDVRDLTPTEIELAQLKIRDVIQDILKKRPPLRSRKSA
jgi:transcriptional regulator with XRE-family HTH domain